MSLRAAALFVLPALAAGCDKPDLSAVRDGLAKNAAIVCAPPPARPAHAPKLRDVPAADLTAALVALCEAQHADAPAPSGAAGVLHDALLADHAEVGAARRSNILLTGTASGACDPTFPVIDRVLLGAAGSAQAQGHYGEALDRCADVVALARDEDLAGTVTDLLFANGQLQHAVEACMPIVEHAPKDAAARFDKSLGILRATFPTSIDDAVARDHAEVLLLRFGQARAQGAPLACPRATQLATASDQKPEVPAKLLATWRASQEQTPEADLAKVREAYALTLGVLDRLISLADLAAK